LLARYFGMTETFWSNLYAYYALEVQKDLLGKRLEKEVAVYSSSGYSWPCGGDVQQLADADLIQGHQLPFRIPFFSAHFPNPCGSFLRERTS
jgi:hypothetical protein